MRDWVRWRVPGMLLSALVVLAPAVARADAGASHGDATKAVAPAKTPPTMFTMFLAYQWVTPRGRTPGANGFVGDVGYATSVAGTGLVLGGGFVVEGRQAVGATTTHAYFGPALHVGWQLDAEHDVLLDASVAPVFGRVGSAGGWRTGLSAGFTVAVPIISGKILTWTFDQGGGGEHLPLEGILYLPLLLIPNSIGVRAEVAPGTTGVRMGIELGWSMPISASL